MMKYLQKLGKSLMLPVACLPVASILMGIGYWIDPAGWGANNLIAAFMIKAGSAIIDNMGILFAIGVGIGMSDDNDGTAGLAGLVLWLMMTTLLSTTAVAMFKGVDVSEVPAAFGKIQTQFTGILSGIIGATCYNKFKSVKLPAGALVMYHCANKNKKKVVYGLLLAGSISAFFTGVTEPLEFAFMFLAPGLYFIHAVLSGISAVICTVLPVIEGFVDWVLSFKAPMAEIILEGLGGKENIISIDNCVTRLRLEIKDKYKINEKLVKSSGASGIIKPGKKSIQIIIGTKVQFVCDELKILYSM